MAKTNNNVLRIGVMIICFWWGYTCAFAQLTQWSGKRTFQVVNNTASPKSSFSYLLVLDTKDLVASGVMAADGSDIRIAADCEGLTVLPHFIESGLGTSETKIWCLISSIPPGGSKDLYVFYDNPNASSTSDFDATFPRQLILTTNDTVNNLQTDSVWDFNYIEISESAIVKFNPNLPTPWQLRMQADKIVIEGALKGDGLGFRGTMNSDGNGPGGGTQEITGGGGAAYGGAGGNGSYGTTPSSAGQGGVPYGAVAGKTVLAGSAGGAAGLVGVSNPGASGGMAIRIFCQDLTVNGVLSSNGNQGQDTQVLYSPGGGAGGGILVVTEHIQGNGIIAANGGRGGNSTLIYYAGGGAGGGRLKLFYGTSYAYNGSLQVNGGAAGMGGITPAEPGEAGTVHIEKDPATFELRSLDTNYALQLLQSPTCVGDTAVVSVNSGGLEYALYRDGDLVQTTTDTVFRFPVTASEQRVLCRVSDGSCVRETGVLVINSNPLPTPLLNSEAPGFCEGDSLLLTVSVSSSTNEWLRNGSTVFSNVNEAYIAQPGNYLIRETSQFGCVGVSNVQTVAEYPLPEPNIFQDGPYAYCAGDSLVLNAMQTEDHRIFWKRTGLVQASDTPVFVINQPGSYSLEYISTEGCKGQPLEFIVNQNPLPDVDFTIVGGTFICGTSNNVLTLMQQNNVASFRWFRNGIRISDEEEITVQDAGSYWLEAFSPGACKITTDAINFTLFPQARIDTVSSHEFCVGERVSLAANDLDGLTYQWSRNGVPIAGAIGQEESFMSAGLVQVAIAADNGCESTSPPTQLFRYNFPSNPSIRSTKDTLFVDVIADAYDWYLDGVFLIQTQNPFLVPDVSGSYTVVAVNQNTCASDTAKAVDFVHPTHVGQIINKHQLAVYPNPANGEFFVVSPVDGTWELHSASGVAVNKGKLSAKSPHGISVSSEGVYTLHIQIADGQRLVYRIVIQ